MDPPAKGAGIVSWSLVDHRPAARHGPDGWQTVPRGSHTPKPLYPVAPAGRMQDLNEQFTFSIREHVRQVPHVLTAEEKVQEKKYGRALWARKYDHVPRDDFTLVVSLANDAYCSQSWKDGKRKRLELLVGEILEELPWMVQRVRKQREENLRRQEERRRAEQRRWDEERAPTKRAGASTALLKEVDEWRKVNGIRAYIHAVEETMRELDLVSDPKVQEWLGWANRVGRPVGPD